MDIKDLVVTGMKQMVLWMNRKKECEENYDCKECHMFRSGHCGKITTEETMRACAGLFREYLTDRKDADDFPQDIRDGMRQLIQWYDMTQFCFGRTSCKDCPYKKHDYCNSASTDDVMITVTKKFIKYLRSKRIPTITL